MAMDLVRSLLRHVVRAFYETKHVIILEALIRHSALRDEDFAVMTSLQPKEVQKICGKLREDRLLTMHTKVEGKSEHHRTYNKTWYFIDYQVAVDAIKFKMYRLQKRIEEEMTKQAEMKGYHCPRCSRKYTAVEAMMHVDEFMIFQCELCQIPLEPEAESEESKRSQTTFSNFNEQLVRVIELLKSIDEVVVPVTDFTKAHAEAVPPAHVESISDGFPHMPPGSATPTANLTTTSSQVAIDFVSRAPGDETAEEKIRKEALAQSNQLPVWHTQSTISGDLTYAGKQSQDMGQQHHSQQETIVDDKSAKIVDDEAIKTFYAGLGNGKRESEDGSQGEPTAKRIKVEEDSDEDEEFEDV
ncbi:Transcription initiation factor IIE subunit alpha [Neolecta irregularis DAH-3]|uniref:Transcription initiation factor IIE subunit alpha n=1 Tax=Neolecta irregularis (strain DAH-3) TaxID=1198029 RepID=A0A1U7LP32_NEOID|nr:Transcription initiation factor IIE subunit alpha [Neolecta irregularis DAH-3]|eukprot:OLL24430.1 Transcription initiation factor IIE subunit alpha [Neolecta irregularis DAH-3]